MDITLEAIKEIREQTGVGVMDVKEALREAKGNTKKALEVIRKKGLAKVLKKSSRDASEGVIESYSHSNRKIGVLVELNCETDFVARNADFQSLAHDIAMQVAASDPRYVLPSDVPAEELKEEETRCREELIKAGKPKAMIPKILEGKLKKYAEELSLVKQPLVKNPDMTVEELIAEKTVKIGEKISIKRFVRFSL